MFLIAAWEIWNTRNNWIFDNGRVSICLWIVKFKEQVLLQLLRVKDVYQPQIVQWLDTIVLESWVFSFASFVPPSSIVSISVSFLPCTILLFYKWKWSLVENFYLFINENEGLWGTPPQFSLKKKCAFSFRPAKGLPLTYPPTSRVPHIICPFLIHYLCWTPLSDGSIHSFLIYYSSCLHGNQYPLRDHACEHAPAKIAGAWIDFGPSALLFFCSVKCLLATCEVLFHACKWTAASKYAPVQ